MFNRFAVATIAQRGQMDGNDIVS